MTLLPHNKHDQQNELREARRLLRDKIRNDWDFETLPRWKSSGKGGRAPGGFRFHHEQEGVMEWREREWGSSEEETEASNDGASGLGKSGNGSVYKFEGPESVGTQLEARKRRRLESLEEECTWNEGLAHWMRRRDRWCEARRGGTLRPPTQATMGEGVVSSGSVSTTSSPRTSTSSSANQTSSSSLATSPDLSALQPTIPTKLPPLSEPLLPLAPPLLPPTHPIRQKIKPSLYPEIYTKIILQSRTPSVPINLQILVHALVQGWKDDGEWPPKPGVPEKAIGRKKGTGLVRRVLRLTGVSEHS